MSNKRMLHTPREVVIKAGYVAIDGLLYQLKEDITAIQCEEYHQPSYLKDFPPLTHDPNGTLGKGRFSKFSQRQ